MFEVIHTLPDWYDGPRGGIADYRGQPHLFASEWADLANNYADTYLLSPVDPETFALAVEDWAIWRRWETAFHLGEVSQDTHPALPADRARHVELARLLAGRLAVDPVRAVRKLAEFRPRADPGWSGLGWAPLEVRWFDPPKLETI